MSDNPQHAAPPSSTSTSEPFWKNEDWLAVVAGLPILCALATGWAPSIGAMMIALAVLMALFFGPRVLFGAVIVLALAWGAQQIAAVASIKAWGIEYVVFALGLGLVWSHLLPMPDWLRNAARAEFLIKVGIVIHGATIALPEIMKAGVPGMIQAALVIPVVWYACFFIAKRLKVDDEFGVMLSTAVSICGVSAAIAACGAIQGDKKKLSYVTSLVLVCAVPMIILMPWAVNALGLSAEVGGAWLGGTLDTTASVTAATKSVGEKAIDIGTVVKASQNVLIGVAAFVLSIWWSMRGGAASGQRVSPSVIWERFPKFVIGFILASVIFSYWVPAEALKVAKDPIKNFRDVWFAAAFVCIGLETRLGELFRLGGGRPAIAFLGGQIFNIAWTLVLAMWLFGK
jgi:uncharacterized integral membrane protein (TIGR00698 family)